MSSARNGLNFLKQVVKARTEAKTFDNVLQGVGITFRINFGIICNDMYATFELTRGIRSLVRHVYSPTIR